MYVFEALQTVNYVKYGEIFYCHGSPSTISCRLLGRLSVRMPSCIPNISCPANPVYDKEFTPIEYCGGYTLARISTYEDIKLFDNNMWNTWSYLLGTAVENEITPVVYCVLSRKAKGAVSMSFLDTAEALIGRGVDLSRTSPDDLRFNLGKQNLTNHPLCRKYLEKR